MAQAFQNTLTFDRYLFNSRSNFHVNLVHWNLLHPKNAIFSVKITKPELITYTIRKLGPLRSFWAQGLGSKIYKKWCNNFYNAVAVECTLYHARPHKSFIHDSLMFSQQVGHGPSHQECSGRLFPHPLSIPDLHYRTLSNQSLVLTCLKFTQIMV